jgi:choline dehydrogenase-like flavoprotein
MFETSKEHLRLIEKDILERPNSHAHQIGGTIMGSDESNSVVNGTGKVHKIENLYVAGSSIFTTAGEANPTHTIVALSIRTSEFLVDLLKSSRA